MASWHPEAYEPSDPKHPSYADRLLEAVDLQRKARKESGLTEGVAGSRSYSSPQGSHTAETSVKEPNLAPSVSPPVGAETFKPPLACQARMPTPGNTWRYCKLPWNHKGEHRFD